MLTKTRTIIITLIAAGSFAGAAIVPAASQAEDNSIYARLSAECEVLRLTHGLWNEAAVGAAEKGEADLADLYMHNAEGAEREARGKGCIWAAAQRRPPSNRPTIGIVAASTPAVPTKSAPTKPVVVNPVTLPKTAVG